MKKIFPFDDIDEVLARWFLDNIDRLPRQPFRLSRWERVGEPNKFYNNIKRQIASGNYFAGHTTVFRHIHDIKAYMEKPNDNSRKSTENHRRKSRNKNG